VDDSKIPEQVRHFIYKYIDSVEILEILLFLRSHPEEWNSAEQINAELKTQASSIAKKLIILKSFGFLEEDPATVGKYKFAPTTGEIEISIGLLAEEYKIRRYRVYELIFSQKNHIKNFADAFIIVNNKNKKDDESG
tara:strand:- start:11644 stop:12054 length:411 start_codon:yes stop_codon:yes gene_type:complete